MDRPARLVLAHVLVLGAAAFVAPLAIGLVLGDATIISVGAYVLAPAVLMVFLARRWSRPHAALPDATPVPVTTAERVKRIVVAFSFVTVLVVLVIDRGAPGGWSLDENIALLGGIAACYFLPLWWPDPERLPRARARFGTTRTS